MFEMLRVLIQNGGQVVDKDTLLKKVWPDSFVEEGNISFNIRQLRKLLGDDAQSPIYIETIPRRGYRFIAQVEEVTEITPTTTNGAENLTQRFANPEPVPVKSSFHPFTPVFIAFVCLVGAGVVYFVLSQPRSTLPVLSRQFESEKLSGSGSVYGAAISPDGKTVLYSNKTGDKQSLWLRQLDSANNVPLVPPSTDSYFDFTFAPDGRSIYFSRSANDIEKPAVYRISLLGGIPDKVVASTEGSFSISPDGTRVSFTRCPRTPEEWCSLWMADAADGRNEKKLLSRPDPNRIGDNEFSPDGQKIAFATGQSRTAANEFQLMEYDLQTETERAATAERFFNIKNLAWLPDQSGLLITASRVPNEHFRIWHVSAATQTAEPLTKDSEVYSIVSVDREGRNVISTQIKEDFSIYLYSIDDTATKRFVANGVRGSFAPDGKFYFASTMSGNHEVWGMNLDGSGQRQLTTDPGGDGTPVTSPDGKTIFFASNRSGQAHVWRMSTDGSSQTQVTSRETGTPVAVSPEGKLVYYLHALHGNLWSVSLESGEEKLVLDRRLTRFALSPDGGSVAFRNDTPQGPELAVMSLATGQTVRTFPLTKEKPKLLSFVWLLDGGSLMYLVSAPTFENGVVYRQPLDGGPRQQIVDLKNEQLSEIANIAIAPDGKHFTAVLGQWKHDAVRIKGLN